MYLALFGMTQPAWLEIFCSALALGGRRKERKGKGGRAERRKRNKRKRKWGEENGDNDEELTEVEKLPTRWLWLWLVPRA